MGRPYTAAQYEATVEAALERMPDACVGADIITGFPGEDEEAFEETVRLVERHPFGNLHVFPYSERPGTPAAVMPGRVPMGERRARARRLLRLADEKRAAFARRFVGKEVEVLVERVGADGVGRGWTGEYLECRVPGCSPADVNTLRRVAVRSADGCVLMAPSQDGGTTAPTAAKQETPWTR
jgi:threonylcarbamoyladenosine tRNA methylthiotransferase MtaB